MSKRILNPAEKTHLARYKPEALETIAEYGEMPVEYISGVAEFCNLLFTVTPDVLIPRLETEELVEMAYRQVAEWLSGSTVKPISICEIGTGSGAVAIALADKLRSSMLPLFANGGMHKRSLEPDTIPFASSSRMTACSIIASDVSEKAVAVAQQNAITLLSSEEQSTKSKVQFLVSDLFSGYQSGQIFDLIIANLPYIPSERIDHLDPSVKDFEPHVALDGGSEGLTLIKKMLGQATGHSHQGTVVLLEVDYTHVTDEFNEFTKDWEIESIEDQFYRQRFVKLIRK